jgi:hypothetical protein
LPPNGDRYPLRVHLLLEAIKAAHRKVDIPMPRPITLSPIAAVALSN